MTLLPRAALRASIAARVADYRQGEVAPITPARVDRWVCQFDPADQLTLLAELDGLLRAYYVSRAEARAFICRCLAHEGIFGPPVRDGLIHTCFLNVQRKGNSQRDLLLMVDEIARAEHGVSLAECGQEPQRYIYLDDCLFTGATALDDLAWAIPQCAPNAELHLVFFAIYRRHLDYFWRRLMTLANTHRLNVHIWRAHEFHDVRARPERFDGLWPTAAMLDDETRAYLRETRRTSGAGAAYLFRPEGLPYQDTFFSSATARDVVERAFLRVGVRLAGEARQPNPYLRPLGYEKWSGLGYGAFFITYRNCPNNCPLALWWGEEGYAADHPLGGWLPLFSRKPN